jgi:23S rRNA pseudouridine1911/1915/1917 synthase
MKHLGHPLLGDPLYGYKPPRVEGFPVVPRVMLHATRLELEHPTNGEPLIMEAPVPGDFDLLVEHLESISSGAESH